MLDQYKIEEIKNNFIKRNERKIHIHLLYDIKFHIKEREIWYVFLWQNIWYEQNWKTDFTRPVLVIKKIWNMIFSLPMTTKWKDNNFYYKIESINFDRPSFLNISQ